MHKIFGKAIPLLTLAWAHTAHAAVDSYRYLHVTIETPWFIFLVLLPMVLAPLVLMGIMVWRFAEHRKDAEGANDAEAATEDKKE
jgi:heme/copper-type cytochrome/quinol oxidase subunit 2